MEHALLSIALLLVAAKVAEGIARRLRQSSLAAYVLAGILLGPILGVVEQGEELVLFFSVGVIFLFFLVGVDEMDISGFAATVRGRFFTAAAIAFLVPFALSLVVMRYFLDFPITATIALAGVLSLSSLGVVAKVLTDLKHLKEPLGLEIFTTVIIVELVGLLIVGFVLREEEGAGGFDIAKVGLLLAQIVSFVVIAWVLAAKLFPPLLIMLRRWLGAPQLTFGVLIAVLLLVVVGAEFIGLHGSLGALLVGTALSGLPHRLRAEVMPGVRSIADGLFVPLFFAAAGLNVGLSFTSLPVATIVAIVAVAVFGKLLGSLAGPLAARLPNPLATGSGLMAKGVVEIAMLLVMLESGLIGPELFSLVTIVMLAFIFLMPPVIGFAINRAKEAERPRRPFSIPPSFARYALDDQMIQDIIDESAQFADVSVPVDDFIEQWVLPEQNDYVITETDDDEIKFAGIFSLQRLKSVPKDRWSELTVGDLARQNSLRAYLDEPLDDVLERMSDHRLMIAPIFERETQVFAGAITSRDVLASMVDADEEH